jgi:hypothetical protein
VPGRIAAAADLVEEPGPPLGLVDEGLEQARAGDVIVLVADIVSFA